MHQPAYSVSREQLLSRCPRAYYWQYIGADPRAPIGSDARRAWTYKHLTDLPRLVGTVVHAAASRRVAAVRDGTPAPDIGDLLAAARFTLNQAWLNSQPRHVDRFYRYPGVVTALRELVLTGEVPERDLATARWTLEQCFAHLDESPLFDDLRQCAAAQILLGDAGPERFEIAPGVHAWVARDLAYRHEDPTTCPLTSALPSLCVVEWKTGVERPDVERTQLAAYALHLDTIRASAGHPPTGDSVAGRDDYLGRVMHLRSGTETWYVLTTHDLERARAGAIAHVTDVTMRLDALRGGASLASVFPLAHDAPRPCSRCSCRPLCEAELRTRAATRRGDHLPIAEENHG